MLEIDLKILERSPTKRDDGKLVYKDTNGNDVLIISEEGLINLKNKFKK